MRAFEIRGESAQTTLRFLGQDRGFFPANMLEENLAGSEQKVLRLGPYEIATIKLRVQ